MITLLFMREAMIAGHQLGFRVDSCPPEIIWGAMRREGWTVNAERLRDDTGTYYHMLDSVIDPDGNTIIRISKKDGDWGVYNTNRQIRKRYRQTVDRLIRAHFSVDQPSP